ncbi:MAG: PKD domain-containing protein [Candidatus Korarchaeum sp.]|nr:PKD domain-containing protein [Candidatus Korarchaeum sp.]
MRSSVLALLLLSLLIPLALDRVNECSGNRCSGSISLSASVPAAVKPGQRIDVSASLDGGCECGATYSGPYINAENGACQTSRSGTYASGYCTVSDVPGGSFRICASGSISGPPCYTGDTPGSTGPLSKCSSAAYIVSVPDFSASANPTALPKQGSVTITASGLSAIDDGKGSLSVVADFNGNTYTLAKTGSGSFSSAINYDMRDKPAGTMQITVTATKTYSGVSASKSKSISVTLLGSPPSISVNAPNEVKRGDAITVTIDEPDGDTVTATLKIGDKSYSLNKGSNSITIDLPKGEYTASVQANDVDGSSSKSFSIRVRGSPPSVTIDAPNQMKRGEGFTVTVTEEDGDSVTGTLTIGDKTFSIGKGSNSIRIPADLRAGDYTILAIARDEDGGSEAEASFTLVNEEPKVSVSVDKTEAKVGETITVTVEASDDSPGLNVRTTIGDKEFSGTGSFEYTPSKEGTLTIKVVATDMDGVTVTKEVSVEVTPGGSSSGGGGGSSGGSSSGGSSGGSGGSGGSSSGSGNSSSSSGGSSSSSNNSSSGNSSGVSANSINSGTSMSASGTKLSASSTNGVRLEVHPEEPYVGDEVTVKVFSPYKGMLVLINPEKREVANTGLTILKYVVDEEGIWIAKYYYNDGKLREVSLSFTVKARPPVEAIAANNTTNSKLGSSSELEALKLPCEVAARNESSIPWYLLAITMLFAALAIRRLKL